MTDFQIYFLHLLTSFSQGMIPIRILTASHLSLQRQLTSQLHVLENAMRPKKHPPNHKVTMPLAEVEVEDEVVLAGVKEVSGLRPP